MTAHGFRNYFTPLPGYFSPFPHGTIHYRSHWVFRLTGWSRQIHSRFHEPAATRANKNKTTHAAFTYRTLTYSGRPFQAGSAYHTHPSAGGYRTDTFKAHNPCHATPETVSHADRFSQQSTFVRHYSRNHNCFLLQRVLRCFTSPPYLPTGYTFTGR